MPQQQQRVYLLLPLLLQPPWLQLIVAAIYMKLSLMTLMNAELLMLFQLLKRKQSSVSRVVFLMSNDLKTQSKETEKKCDVPDRKVLNRKEIRSLRIMEEDKVDIYHPQGKVEFRN